MKELLMFIFGKNRNVWKKVSSGLKNYLFVGLNVVDEGTSSIWDWSSLPSNGCLHSLSQDLESGHTKWGIIKFWGVQCSRETIIISINHHKDTFLRD